MKLEYKFYLFKYIKSKDTIKEIGKGKTITELKTSIVGKRTRPNYEIILISLTKEKTYKARVENKLIGPIKVNFQMFNFNNDKFETKQETNQHEFLSKEQTKKLDDELKKTVHIFIKNKLT